MTENRRVLSREAMEFAPGLLSIQENPPSRLPRAVMWSVATLFALLLVWACFGKLDIITSAEGRLVPQTYVKIVQPADAGIVQDILVKEGQAVKAGQVLMRMDMNLAKADQAALADEVSLKALQLKRTDAELAGRALTSQGLPADLFDQVNHQYRDRRQHYEDERSQAEQSLQKARHDYTAGQEILTKLKEVTPILKQQSDSYAEMGKEGFVPLVTVRDKQREYIEKARDLAAQEANVASLAAATAAAEKQLALVSSKYRSDLRNEQVEAEGQYRKLQQEQVKQEHKSQLLELRAPQAGIVRELATHTKGTVVSPGTVLLSLVPEGEPLVAEVVVKNDDVGFVYPEQKVKVKLVPYSFEKYGMLNGDVIYVGADAMEMDGASSQGRDANKDGNKASPTQGYRVLIALKEQVLSAQGEQYKLVPGMQVVAEINQGQRTVMEYLLSPVRKTLHDSGRER